VQRRRVRPGRPLSPTSERAWRTRKEAVLAQRRELEPDWLRGFLVAKDEVAQQWGAICRQVGAAVLAVPSRVRARCPQLTAEDVQVIAEEIGAALSALGNEDAR
jgi:phage terminase Nu1 subunit (DNA packaging protein)